MPALVCLCVSERMWEGLCLGCVQLYQRLCGLLSPKQVLNLHRFVLMVALNVKSLSLKQVCTQICIHGSI